MTMVNTVSMAATMMIIVDLSNLSRANCPAFLFTDDRCRHDEADQK